MGPRHDLTRSDLVGQQRPLLRQGRVEQRFDLRGPVLSHRFEHSAGKIIQRANTWALVPTALGRVAHPDDVAAAVLLLTMPESRWVTGGLIDASGGGDL